MIWAEVAESTVRPGGVARLETGPKIQGCSTVRASSSRQTVPVLPDQAAAKTKRPKS